MDYEESYAYQVFGHKITLSLNRTHETIIVIVKHVLDMTQQHLSLVQWKINNDSMLDGLFMPSVDRNCYKWEVEYQTAKIYSAHSIATSL